MCVSGFPTLPSFWHPTLNFFLNRFTRFGGNQAILLKKRSEKLFSRVCLSKLCPVNSKSSLALPKTTESRFVWSAEMLTTHCNTSHPISTFDVGWQPEILSPIARLPAELYYSIRSAQNMRALSGDWF